MIINSNLQGVEYNKVMSHDSDNLFVITLIPYCKFKVVFFYYIAHFKSSYYFIYRYLFFFKFTEFDKCIKYYNNKT